MQRSKLRKLLTTAVAALTIGGVALAQTTLVIGTGAELSHLDPRVATDVPSFERINAIMEPLVHFGPDLGLLPRLATDWEFAEDGLTLTFNLREGVTFHNGNPFTSADVKYTFDWVLDESNGATNRPLYADIDTIDTPDDHTVVFNLSSANSFLLNNIARMPIVPTTADEDPNFTFNPVGTGPYAFDSLIRDDILTLVAYDEYWGGRGEIDVVEFRPIPENSTRLLAFEAGEVHLSQSQPPPTELARLEADDSFVVERAPGTGYTYIGMNTAVSPLDDVRVRQAISYLVNREAIVDLVLEGIGQPGVSMLSPELAWYTDDVEHYSYNPERALELVAEAGYADGGLSLRLHTNENPVRMLIAEIMQAELANVGINLEVTIEEFGAFLERVQTTDDFDMFILGWSGQLDPDRSMQRQFTTDGSSNYTGYSNPRVDELIALGRMTPPDSQESLDIYAEAQKIIVDDASYAYVNYTEEIAFRHPWVSGWSIHPYSANAYQDLHLVSIDR